MLQNSPRSVIGPSMVRRKGSLSILTQTVCHSSFVRAMPFVNTTPGQITLVHVDPSHHAIRQRLTIVDGPPTPETTLEASGSNTHLPLPNPFKVALMGLRSSDNLAQEAREEDGGRVLLTTKLDLGILPLNGPLVALRLLESASPSLGVAWSSGQLSVGGMCVAAPASERAVLTLRCSISQASLCGSSAVQMYEISVTFAGLRRMRCALHSMQVYTPRIFSPRPF